MTIRFDMKASMKHDYCVFEYMYRDAGNWNTHGALLLAGNADKACETLRQCLEWEDLFVAEQVGIASLCARHFADHGEEPSDLDHAFHEFIDLRPATAEEVASMSLAGSLDEMMVRMRATAGCWDVSMSLEVMGDLRGTASRPCACSHRPSAGPRPDRCRRRRHVGCRFPDRSPFPGRG